MKTGIKKIFILALAAVMIISLSICFGLAFPYASAEPEEVSDADVWDGESSDTSFYTFSSNTLYIDSAARLKGFADLTRNGFSFEGLTVELTTDVDLNGNTWYPIENFAGVFDGGNHTVSNGVLNVVGSANVGFFGEVNKIVTIQNLTLKNFTSAAVSDQLNGKSVGILLGQNNANGTRILNCDIDGGVIRLETSGYPDSGKNALLVGRSKGSILIDGCTIKNSFIFDDQIKGYRYGAILGGNTTVKYESLVRNCNIWNTYVLGYNLTGTAFGLICGEGSAVRVENFHTNMMNYTAGNVIDGRYDLTMLELPQGVIDALDGFNSYDAYTNLRTTNMFGGSSYYTGDTSYDGTLFESSFKVDDTEYLPSVWSNYGVIDFEENIQEISIVFDVEVEASVTVNGVKKEDTNADGKIVDISLDGGASQTAIDIYYDGIIVAHYDIVSGVDISTYELLMEGAPITENRQFLQEQDGILSVTEHAKNIGVQFNAAAPSGSEFQVNGISADEFGIVTFESIPERLDITLVSGSNVHFIKSYQIVVWKQAEEGNESVYYADSSLWSYSDGVFNNICDSQSQRADIEILIRDVSEVSITYNLKFVGEYEWATVTFEIAVDGVQQVLEEGYDSVITDKVFSMQSQGLVHRITVESYFRYGTSPDKGYVNFRIDVVEQDAGIASDGEAGNAEPEDVFEDEGNDAISALLYASVLSDVSEETSEQQKYSDNVYYSVKSGNTSTNTWSLKGKEFTGYNGDGNEDTIVLTLYFKNANLIYLDYKLSIYNYDFGGYFYIDDITNSESPVSILGQSVGESEYATIIKQYDTVGDYVWRLTYYRKYSGASNTCWLNNIYAGNSAQTCDISITYNEEFGNVYDIYNFADKEFVSYDFWGNQIQPWAVAKEGYRYVGYRLNGGELIKSNGDIFTLTEDVAFEFVFEPKIAIEDEKLTDFTFVWFTDGQGWNSARHNLEETFDVLEHIYNINDMENGIIGKIMK